jgi:hypothetical protein
MLLDGDTIDRGISPMLLPMSRVSGKPKRLKENFGHSFQGSIVLGLGFVLDRPEAEELLASPENSEIVFPYLNGEDLNSRPDQSASRFAINFYDWPRERATEYKDCYAIVEERVKPERAKNNRKIYADRWWQYGEKRTDLYRAIDPLERVIAITLVSKVVMPALVENNQVFSHMLGIFAYDDFAHLALLSSSHHWWWAVTYASTLETRIRYTPTDCFETFPQPHMTASLADCGRELHEFRQELMLARQTGLTATYNLFHRRECQDKDIHRLRSLHIAVDEAVKHAYALSDPGYPWATLDLEHGFYETTQGMKFTIGPAARAEILDRLLELNFERHAAEAAEEGATKKPRKAPRARPTSQTALGI